jgi:hypothetical protein
VTRTKTRLDLKHTIVVSNVVIEIEGRLMFITILVAKNSLEDVTIFKLDVGSGFVEAHSVDLGKKNAE